MRRSVDGRVVVRPRPPRAAPVRGPEEVPPRAGEEVPPRGNGNGEGPPLPRRPLALLRGDYASVFATSGAGAGPTSGSPASAV